MHRLLNGLILTPLLAEDVRMTECHAVCIGAFPAQTTVLYRSARKWPFHTTPLVTSGLHISRKWCKSYGFHGKLRLFMPSCAQHQVRYGRLHRYLIHYVLAERGFNPPGMMFPVSAAILDNINAYQRILESYSVRLLPFIKWKATGERSVRVLNETAGF
ncbi:hypothetical protein [Bradyrhizobium tunisiense]|uniref:hypothetical protein n=1 Tax=Bradyrhizobium tunisiense TaxID=3278709 RepID=UPI0035DCDAF4